MRIARGPVVLVGSMMIVGCMAGAAGPAHAQQCSEVGLGYDQVDLGWNGVGHGMPGLVGEHATLGVVAKCAGTVDPCATNADCTAVACEPTCSVGGPSSCELVGPSGPRRCLRSLDVCTTNADCSPTETCESFLAPPIPLSADGVPVCATIYTTAPITGTRDLVTGDSVLDVPPQRWRMHLGLALASPCPRCGAPGVNPQVGEAFTCNGSGSPNHGLPCTVDGVSPDFGGVSYDCPPPAGHNVSGVGLGISFREMTTGTLIEQAVLPCGFPLSEAHPDSGNAVCMDDFAPCATNADCTRCSDDLSPCVANADCGLGVECAKSPDQPISCGIYCHCGYCEDDVDQACFSDADCAPGDECLPGSGVGLSTAQVRNNGCSNLLCGEEAPETCCTGDACTNDGTPGFGPTPPLGSCSLAPYRPCSGSLQCAATGSGICVFAPRPCFAGRVARAGTPSPASQLCTSDAGSPPCSTNTDCTTGVCEAGCTSPVYAALACMPPTSSAAVSSSAGILGPIAMRVNGGFVPPPTLPTTTTTTLAPPSACPGQPATGCFEADNVGLRIKRLARPANRKLTWNWARGEAVAQADYADPTSATVYRLCLYDEVADVASLASELVVAPGASWASRGPRGYVFDDRGAAGGARRVRLQTGAAGRARARLIARGANLVLPQSAGLQRFFAQDSSVRAQLVATNGRCWDSTFSAGDTRTNSGTRFHARSRR